MKGIDISMHNGAIDFNAVKNSGVEVVIIKATEGVEYIDPFLEEHYNGANNSGLNLGFYHFMSEKTNPSQQAKDFWNAIKDKEFNVIPVLDIEVNTFGRNAREITDRCLEFLTKFKELSGLDCCIYTGGYFGRDNLDSRIKSYPAWIAHYGVDKPMETGFNKVAGHQYTEHGACNGINGRVDLNNFTEEILIKESKPVESPKIESNYDSEYAESGNATILVSDLRVRTEPKLTAETVAYYQKGEVIKNYDRVVHNDGYVWIRYKGASGNYRYVAVKDLRTGKRFANCY